MRPHSLIRRGHALPYTAHATSPTITMPRVKALTTGSIPSFLDVILNFAESDTTSTLAGQDTWLAQLGSKGRSAIGQSIGESQSMLEKEQQEKKLVFYGDNTWLKLFPGFFERADGTSSFFVSVSFSTLPKCFFSLTSPRVEHYGTYIAVRRLKYILCLPGFHRGRQ